jgi:hypothetical protein
MALETTINKETIVLLVIAYVISVIIITEIWNLIKKFFRFVRKKLSMPKQSSFVDNQKLVYENTMLRDELLKQQAFYQQQLNKKEEVPRQVRSNPFHV